MDCGAVSSGWKTRRHWKAENGHWGEEQGKCGHTPNISILIK